jgi:hypothetical protein
MEDVLMVLMFGNFEHVQDSGFPALLMLISNLNFSQLAKLWRVEDRDYPVPILHVENPSIL